MGYYKESNVEANNNYICLTLKAWNPCNKRAKSASTPGWDHNETWNSYIEPPRKIELIFSVGDIA